METNKAWPAISTTLALAEERQNDRIGLRSHLVLEPICQARVLGFKAGDHASDYTNQVRGSPPLPDGRNPGLACRRTFPWALFSTTFSLSVQSTHNPPHNGLKTRLYDEQRKEKQGGGCNTPMNPYSTYSSGDCVPVPSTSSVFAHVIIVRKGDQGAGFIPD